MTDVTVMTGDGVRLRARSDGPPDAPPLLLLNSLGTDLAMWAPQVPTWTHTHRVIRFDQRGHGRSEVPPPPYTIDQLGADAVAVLDAFEVEQVDVCGLSLGGLVALWLGGRRPERIRRLILADTAARIGTEQAWRERAATVRSQGTSGVTELALSRFFSPAFLASGGNAVRDVEAMLVGTSPSGYIGSCEALARADLTDLVPTVASETLVIVGSEDAATPPEEARALDVTLAHSHLVELSGAGHLANLEATESFAEVVRAFLTRDRTA